MLTSTGVFLSPLQPTSLLGTWANTCRNHDNDTWLWLIVRVTRRGLETADSKPHPRPVAVESPGMASPPTLWEASWVIGMDIQRFLLLLPRETCITVLKNMITSIPWVLFPLAEQKLKRREGGLCVVFPLLFINLWNPKISSIRKWTQVKSPGPPLTVSFIVLLVSKLSFQAAS